MSKETGSEIFVRLFPVGKKNQPCSDILKHPDESKRLADCIPPHTDSKTKPPGERNQTKEELRQESDLDDSDELLGPKSVLCPSELPQIHDEVSPEKVNEFSSQKGVVDKDFEIYPSSQCSAHDESECKLSRFTKTCEPHEENVFTELDITDGKEDENTPCSISNIRSTLRQRYGVPLALLSALAYSGQSILMKVSTAAIDPVMLVVLMPPVMSVCSLICLVQKGIRPPKVCSQFMWLLFGGAFMSSYLTLLSFALVYVDVGDAITVTYTSLILVGIVSWLMLKEPPQKLDVIFSIIAFGGVIFIARPPFIFGSNNEDGRILLGVAFAFGSAISIAFVINVMRKQQQLGINAFASLVVNGVVMFITGVILATVLQRWRIPCLFEWLSSLGAGFCYFLAQLTLYYALRVESSTLINVILTTEIVFAFILQLTILNIHPSWTSYVGAILVTMACIGITLNKKG